MSENVQNEEGKRYTVALQRGDSSVPWGFRLQGGSDFSTPLSVQTVQPNSVAERYGLESGDCIEAINYNKTATMTHDDAKKEIIRSANELTFNILRGAVTIWKPQVTPMSQLRPAQLTPIQSATGDYVIPIQKTSLARSPQPEAPHIGSAHNRAARPFSTDIGTPKRATPTVTHSQFNSPIGLYSANNIAETYATQTKGIADQIQDTNCTPDNPNEEHDNQLEDCDQSLDSKCVIPQPVESQTSNDNHLLLSQPETCNTPSGFRSVRPPESKPPGEQTNKPSLSRCSACDMLITGVFVRVSGQPYHVQCYKCTSCSMNLKQKGSIVVDGKLYCDVHAKRAAQPPGANMVAMATFE